MNTTLPRILLVEDDLTLASLYKMRMEVEGFTVLHSANGEAALQAIADFKPHLILLDIMMPKLDGFSVLDIVRNMPDTKAVKIIVLSALGQAADQQRAMDLGADDFLVKSQVVIADVMASIRHQLGLPPNPATQG